MLDSISCSSLEPADNELLIGCGQHGGCSVKQRVITFSDVPVFYK